MALLAESVGVDAACSVLGALAGDGATAGPDAVVEAAGGASHKPSSTPARVPTTPIRDEPMPHHRLTVASFSSSLNCSCSWRIASRRSHSFEARMSLVASGFQPFWNCASSTSESASSSSWVTPAKPSANALRSDLSSGICASVLAAETSHSGAASVRALEPGESGAIQRACAVHNLCSARSNV